MPTKAPLMHKHAASFNFGHFVASLVGVVRIQAKPKMMPACCKAMQLNLLFVLSVVHISLTSAPGES